MAENHSKSVTYTSKFKNLLSDWKRNLQKYFFTYHDGFYHVYILRNSPILMIENFTKMPLMKHDVRSQIVSFNIMFLDAKIFYLNIEEGLTVILSDGVYKKNVMDQFIYDDRVPVEYYSLALKTTRSQLKTKNSLYNGTVYDTDHWILAKPNGVKNVCHFKDSQELFFTVYFTESWLKNFLLGVDEDTRQFFNFFISSSLDFIMWPNRIISMTAEEDAVNHVFVSKAPVTDIQTRAYRKKSLQMFADFAACLPSSMLNEAQFNMTNEQRLKVLRAENYLGEFYMRDFPGVETLAEYSGISTTGLKTGFQMLFGSSVYKYFQKQKMLMAHQILQRQRETKIKDLAIQMGYENSAKFAAAFKEVLGILPSQVASSSTED